MSAPQQSQYAHTEEAKYIISLNEKLLTENNEQRATISEKDAEINTLLTIILNKGYKFNLSEFKVKYNTEIRTIILIVFKLYGCILSFTLM